MGGAGIFSCPPVASARGDGAVPLRQGFGGHHFARFDLCFWLRVVGAKWWKLSPVLAEYLYMTYVYILRSITNTERSYVGITKDLKERLQTHNRGKSAYTAQFRPWRLETYIAFSNEGKAKAFEKYLKHGSGHAFLKRYL